MPPYVTAYALVAVLGGKPAPFTDGRTTISAGLQYCSTGSWLSANAATAYGTTVLVFFSRHRRAQEGHEAHMDVAA